MKKNFLLGYFFGLFLFFLTSEQNLNLAKTEKIDLRLLETRQVVIFDQETKIFITAYKLAERSVDEYLTTGNIGSN